MQTGSLKVDGSPRPRSTRVHWLEVEQRLSADASVRQPAAPKKVAKLKRIEGFSREGTFARRARLFVLSGPAAPAAIVFLSPKMTTSSSRRRKVISLVERREETWDGKAERNDGTGHRFDRRRRPAHCAQARASRRARAGVTSPVPGGLELRIAGYTLGYGPAVRLRRTTIPFAPPLVSPPEMSFGPFWQWAMILRRGMPRRLTRGCRQRSDIGGSGTAATAIAVRAEIGSSARRWQAAHRAAIEQRGGATWDASAKRPKHASHHDPVVPWPARSRGARNPRCLAPPSLDLRHG